MAIAQTQTEQTKSPTITVLTTQWAFQNSVNSDRSEEVSGSTDCATSAGFIGTSFPLDPSVEPARRNIRNQRARATMPPTRQVENRLSREIRMYRPPEAYEIPAKLGQTW